MASMLVSGKAALQANSDKHFTASWKESMAAGKWCWKMVAGKQRHIFNKTRIWKRGLNTHTNTGDDYCSEKSKEGMSMVSGRQGF